MHLAPFPCLAFVVVLQPALQLPNALLSNLALLLILCCMPLLVLSELPCCARDCWGQRLSATASVICSCRAWMWRSHSSSAAKQTLQTGWTELRATCALQPVELFLHLLKALGVAGCAADGSRHAAVGCQAYLDLFYRKRLEAVQLQVHLHVS